MGGLKFLGGQKVGAGDYWDFHTGNRVHVAAEGVLPGDALYYRLPAIAVLLLAPLAGLAYALFLPFIGLAFVGTLILKALLGRTADGFLRTATFNWRPSEAYLAGKRSSGARPEGAADRGEKPTSEAKK
jgi:hypothetical protein